MEGSAAIMEEGGIGKAKEDNATTSPARLSSPLLFSNVSCSDDKDVPDEEEEG